MAFNVFSFIIQTFKLIAFTSGPQCTLMVQLMNHEEGEIFVKYILTILVTPIEL